MTLVLERATEARPALRRNKRRWAWGLGAIALLLWSLSGAGLFTEPVLNPGGLEQLRRFAAAALSPSRDAAFLAVLAEAALVTVAYAALGAAFALVLGTIGAVAVARTTWGRRRGGWMVVRGALAVPRGLHEVVWGLLMVNVLGLNPWVGVLAIGLPYGAITAKVFADLIDESPRGTYRALLASGASRGTATLYGLLPAAAGGLLSYSFYRFECAVRSAVVLGLIGAGGLGYQLALSFTSLRWAEVWSAVYALAGLCLLADVSGRAVRRRAAAPKASGGGQLRRDRLLTAAVIGTILLVAWSWWFLQVSPATLVSDRAGEQVAYLLQAAWPPATEAALLSTIGSLTIETLHISVIAIALAGLGSIAFAGVVARPTTRSHLAHHAAGALVRILLLMMRAVPPPVWALVLLFVFRPGVLPGALALGVYTLGVLGRLVGEAAEEVDRRPRSALTATGVSPFGGWLYAVLPALSGPVLALSLYRWEVAIRDTVLVGVLGAGGIGALLSARLGAFDWPAVMTVLAAIVLLTFLVDLVSDRARDALR